MKCIKYHNNKKRTLATRLPSYHPLNILVRFVIIGIIAVGILHLLLVVVPEPEGYSGPPAIIYIVMIMGFNVAAEVQILLDNILERVLPVPKKIKLRIALQISLGLLTLVAAHSLLMRFLHPQILERESESGVFMGILTGLVFVQMVANSLTIARLTQKMLDTQEEMAEIKREKLRMDYNSLQDQINPHFLFNNLSVLKSLITYDQESALNFTENFTDVYRYVLQSKDKRLVKLTEEMEFMKAYYGLHKERLGDGLIVEKDFPEVYWDKEIAPLTAQLLMENAIKHNITSKETPLRVKAYIEDDYLIVSNSINRRESSYSTKTGLKNLVKRYALLTEREVVIQYNEERFEVKVPLL
ncbi:histidine kinase [uncultured Draconibacterium sp.]|uniref:sensor histidine kinase n=1 Tax=uncultured Draconibacterium sp. TaxID=1573823 RepID=UPI0025D7C9D4|nr:histidine kinase [uncultured Draconibacterium sp.]